MALTPTIKPGDWNSVRKAIQSLSRQLGKAAAPTMSTVTLTDLTGGRLVATDSGKTLEAVADLTAWVSGTSGEITVTDDGDGTITLSLADPLTLDGGTLTALTPAVGESFGFLMAITHAPPLVTGGTGEAMGLLLALTYV